MSLPEEPRRRLPAMGRLLQNPAVSDLIALYGRERVRTHAEAALGALRDRLTDPDGLGTAELDALVGELPLRLASELESAYGRRLRRVLNATGIFIHTNLGRAPLPRAVAEAMPPLLDAYCDVEMDLEEGRRDNRNRLVEDLLKALTGAPAALAVNNNAAALVLVLATLARDRQVVVSRGELVEIGGSFRIPTILEAAGCGLKEIGSTNRTRLADYDEAIDDEVAVVLKVFPSNYRQVGFVESVSSAALHDLCRRRGVVLLVDEGSGLLRPSSAGAGTPQLAGHTSFSELMDLGCDLVCGSGDKLLGGPQAGILVGDRELVEHCNRHPLYRALRPDRATLRALAEVLRLHLAGRELPIHRLWGDPESLEARLERLAAAVGGEIVAADAFLGGGSAPEEAIPGRALSLPADDGLAARLRRATPAIVVSQRHGRLFVDLRTVDPADDELLREAFVAAIES